MANIVAGERAAGPARGTRPAVAVGGLALAAGYGAVRVYWELGGTPERLSPVGRDLMVFDGWSAVGLLGAAALLQAIMIGVRPRGAARVVLLTAAYGVAAALAAAGAMLLLDVVGGLLPGLGIVFFPLGALSRAACAGSGLLLALAAGACRRATREGCAACGRTAASPARPERTPGWAYAAAYGAAAACAVRIAAQAVVGFGESPFGMSAAVIVFEAGFVLAGFLLPLALVHRWGRVWPGWVPLLAGRRVPRPLVLWPGAAVAAGLDVYFGLMFATMVYERLNGRNPFPPGGGLDLPEPFFWVSVPAYLAWGVGLTLAAVSYARLTRRPCAACAR
ncbi:hypothetical protein [Bailinhaonella thermotolerans]|uniref:DUF3995 domain-containing protein n=1 Tax=Bailinhaonella thermotolerans TaxID=1070861 RepID=A0A3A4AF34_9ACTN|nr:hypothetical protein [Bailinhaonella thermotolerans]RJL27111.1 hypothetical protein D5H75_25185 [Bailinhaonella thermotolerans]